MKRFLLLLPAAVALPLIVAVAAPSVVPPSVAPPGAGSAAPQIMTPLQPKMPPGQSAPAASGSAKTHEHDHEAEEADDPNAKPKDPIGDSVDYLWKQSDVAFHAGDYPTAVKIHRAIVTLDPTDSESFGVGAWLLWSLNQKPQARAFIAQGLAANPKDPEMWMTAGGQYDLEKSFADAKNAYTRAIALKGKGADEMLRRRLAHASELSGDLKLSEQTWIDLVRDFPASPVNKNNLARVKALRVNGPAKAMNKA